MNSNSRRLAKLETGLGSGARIEQPRIYTTQTGTVRAITMRGVFDKDADEPLLEFERRAQSHCPGWMTLEAMTDEDLAAAHEAYGEFLTTLGANQDDLEGSPT